MSPQANGPSRCFWLAHLKDEHAFLTNLHVAGVQPWHAAGFALLLPVCSYPSAHTETSALILSTWCVCSSVFVYELVTALVRSRQPSTSVSILRKACQTAGCQPSRFSTTTCRVLLTDWLVKPRRTAESDRDDSHARYEGASTELKARRTAYELLHTDWLASQGDLKAHRHVLTRLNTM